MERWDESVLDINVTLVFLGQKCEQLLATHALTGCDTTSYLYGKGKVTALNTMISGNFQGLATVGEVSTTHQELLTDCSKAIHPCIVQPATRNIYGSCSLQFVYEEEEPRVMALPPTSENLLQHILRAHLQIMLWKEADCEVPPAETRDITNFGWKFQDEIPIPVIAGGDSAPPELLDVIQCQCKVHGKKCSTEACECHKQHMSCTKFCNWQGGQDCLNPFTAATGIVQPAEEATDADYNDIKITSRQRSGKGAIRKRFPLQKPRWEKTKLTIRYLYHENIS